MNGNLIDVVIADDHDLFRDGLASLLQHDPQVRVVGQASNGEDAARLVSRHNPTLVLLDVEMPDSNVRATLSRIRRQTPKTIVVILTMHADTVLRHDLLTAGATGYLTKTLSGAEVIQAIHQYAHGRIDRSSQTTALASGDAMSPLTARETTVLSLMAKALPNTAIAEELSIAVGTVRRHVYSIFRKLGAANRVGAIRRGEALGIITKI